MFAAFCWLLSYAMALGDRANAQNYLLRDQLAIGMGGVYEKLADGRWAFVSNYKLRSVPPELWHR